MSPKKNCGRISFLAQVYSGAPDEEWTDYFYTIMICVGLFIALYSAEAAARSVLRVRRKMVIHHVLTMAILY